MKKIVLSLGILLASIALGQNQFHMTQFALQKEFINPAAMHSHHSLNASLFSRMQWLKFEGAPRFQGLSVSTPSKSFDHAYGGMIIHDKIGVHENLQLSGQYAYRLQLDRNTRLAFGLGASMNFISAKYSEVNTIVDNDPTFAQDAPMKMAPNFRFGSYLYSEKYSAGFSIQNLMKNSLEFSGANTATKTAFDPSDMHIYLHGSYVLDASSELDLIPTLLLKHVAGSPLQYEINLMGKVNEVFGIGLTYRSSKEFALMANYEWDEKFQFGYAYDMLFSDLSVFSSGTHELMFIYKVRSSKRDKYTGEDKKKDDGGGGIKQEL